MMKWLTRHFETVLITLMAWMDGLVIVAACIVAWLGSNLILDTEVPFGAYGGLFVLFTAVSLLSFWAFGLYSARRSILNIEEYKSLILSTLVACLLSALLVVVGDGGSSQGNSPPSGSIADLVAPPLRFLSPQVDASNVSLFLPLAFFCILVLVGIERVLFFRLAASAHARGIGNISVVIFGTGKMAVRLEQKLRLFPRLGFQLVGFLDDDPRMQGKSFRGRPVLGGRRDLPELVANRGVQQVLVSDPGENEEDLSELGRICDQLELDYKVVPRLHHFFTQRIKIEALDSIPLISTHSHKSPFLYALFKRLLDIVVAAIVLLLASLPMFFIGFLIRRESPGSALFTQVRVGLDGRTFRMVKFRTMYTQMCGDAESPSSSSDPRITRLGRILRRTSLDELPQFLNVLRGDMSLVGPRPEMPFIVDSYSEIDRVRLMVKPGITGLWQVSADREAPIHLNVDYDLYYVENRSALMDTVIMVMTLFAVFRGRGAS